MVSPYKILIESLAYSITDETESEDKPLDYKIKRAKEILTYNMGPEFIPGVSSGLCTFNSYEDDILHLRKCKAIQRFYEVKSDGHNDDQIWVLKEDEYWISDITYIISSDGKEYIIIDCNYENSYSNFCVLYICLTDRTFDLKIDFSYSRNLSISSHSRILRNLSRILKQDCKFGNAEINQITNIIKAFNPNISTGKENMTESISYSFDDELESDAETDNEAIIDRRILRAKDLLLYDIGPEFIPGISQNLLIDKYIDMSIIDLGKDYKSVIRMYEAKADNGREYIWSLKKSKYWFYQVGFVIADNKEYVYIGINYKNTYRTFLTILYCLTDSHFEVDFYLKNLGISGIPYTDDNSDSFKETLRYVANDLNEREIDRILEIIKAFKPNVNIK